MSKIEIHLRDYHISTEIAEQEALAVRKISDAENVRYWNRYNLLANELIGRKKDSSVVQILNKNDAVLRKGALEEDVFIALIAGEIDASFDSEDGQYAYQLQKVVKLT